MIWEMVGALLGAGVVAAAVLYLIYRHETRGPDDE